MHRVPRLWPRLPDCSCPSHWAGIPKHIQSTSRHNSIEQGEVKKTLSAVVACIRLHHISIPLLGKLREVSTCHTERTKRGSHSRCVSSELAVEQFSKKANQDGLLYSPFIITLPHKHINNVKKMIVYKSLFYMHFHKLLKIPHL